MERNGRVHSSPQTRPARPRRWPCWLVVGVLIWQGVTRGRRARRRPRAHLSRGTVILNSGILVFREGLEVILVLAAITASFQGANAGYRRPVAAGAGLGLLATVATWFIAVAIIGAVNAPALDIQAATGLLAIVVLLVVMNWFFHRVYWTGWIAHHTPAAAAPDGARGRRARGHAASACPARLHRDVPRGLRDRALPAEPALAGGHAPSCCTAWRSASPSPRSSGR